MNNIDNIYSLSPLQQGLLFHQHYEPDSRVYHQQLSLQLDGTLDMTAFRAAWHALMARHAVLRTSFLWDDLDDAYQVVHKDLALPLRELDWRGEAGGQDALRALEQEQRAAAFAFDEAPLMRVCLVRLAQTRWQMIWTYHHILLDGWSVGIVLRDWMTLYRAGCGGAAAALPPLRAYADYIGWLDEQDAAAAERFWRNRLQDFADPTPLPGFVPRRDIPAGPPCAERQLLLDQGETASLGAFARARHLTLNTLVQGAWALLLGAHAGRDEVLFGVTSGGRPADLAGVDDMAGLFINTLPLRTGWSDRPLLADWLRAIQDANSEQRQYEYTPLARLRAYSSVASERALFEAILVFENFPVDEALAAGGGSLRFSTASTESGTPLRLTEGRNNYPLSLIVAPGAALELTMCYQRARLGDDEVATLLEQLRALLLAMPAHADAPVQELAWPVAAEQRQLRAWGKGVSVPVPPLCLHQLFERHVDLAPDQVAVASAGLTLSYRELERRANRLAHHLVAQGIEPGQVVAIALERSPDFVVAMLATLKAGACYLPLDVRQPAARLAGLLADSGAAALVCGSGWQLDVTPPLLRMDDEAPWRHPDSRPRVAGLSPQHPCYLIYTSGSTGQPKGALLEHHAIVDYVTGVLHALQLPAASRFALLSTVAADLGHTQLFGALCGGGTLVLVDEETAFQPAALADYMRARQVDVLKLTPSQLRGLLAAHGEAALLPGHTLILGGEQVDAGLLRQVQTLAPALRVFNHYGPTETAVGAVLNRLDGRRFDGPVPLGGPQPNRRLYVLDDEGRPAGLGVPGELYIGGGAIARGYLGRPELNAERFLPDTIANDGGRMYRTGDRVCWLAGGELRFLGRVDSQVKIRGYRVELGEVEAQVRRLSPRITQVLARLADVPGQGQHLLAYVVAEGALAVDKLRADMALLVPDYMVPACFLQLDTIALNANGKPDLRQLPLPTPHPANHRAIAPPRNALEATLVGLWQAVLKTDAIGIDDNFFELGGDSILSLQIIGRASQQGIRITPKELFEHRTIAMLAAHLAHGSADASGGGPASAAAAAPVPLSAGQHARVASGRLGTECRCLRLQRECEPGQVQAALEALIAHHPGLRLRAVRSGDSWHQQEGPTAAGVAHASLDAGALRDADALARVIPQAGTGLQATLLACGEERAILLSAPSLLLDAASWNGLVRDFALALSQVRFGRAIALPAPGADFAAFARCQHALAAGDALDAAWEHWLEQADVTPCAIAAGGSADTVTCSLDRDRTSSLLGLRRRMDIDWQALLLAALVLEFAEQPGVDTVALELACAGVDGAIGCFSHEAPFYLRSSAGDALDTLMTVAAQVRAGREAGEQYGVLRHLCSNNYLQDSLSALPQPRLALSWQGARDAHCEAHGVVGPVLAAGTTAPCGPHDLQIAAWLADGCLTLECRGRLAQRATALLTHLSALAECADGVTSRRDGKDTAPADDGRLVEDSYPLSPTQHGMLLHTLLAPESGVYLVQQRFRWDGPLDAAALESAWRTVVARHPILRTRFEWEDGQAPRQYVLADIDPGLSWHDWRSLAATEQEPRLAAELAAESRRGLDLARGPTSLLRVYRMDEQRHELVRTYHHILSDGWSFGRLMEELLHLYRAARRAEPAALPPAPPYRAYIDWLARQPAGAAEDFWRRELAGFSEPTVLPLMGHTPSIAAQECSELEVLLSVAHSSRLEQLCRELQLTLNTWVQGAWALLLARYCGVPEVLFGVTVAGRPATLPGAGDIVGLFINTLPLRVAVPEQQTVAAWLQGLMARNVALREHEHAALSDIQRWSEVGAGRALFDTLLVFENAPFGADAAGLDAAVDTLHDRSPTNYPITVTAMPGERLGLRLAFQSGRFDRAAMGRLSAHLMQLLVQMLEQPHAALGQLEMLTSAEHLELDRWNDSAHAFPLEQNYAALFAARVAEHPDRVAAVCSGISLSYAELDRRATRIARALLERGAGRDTVVALLAERGLDLLAMMIGVLKAGSAFQPLDVNHPPRRLGDLLALSKSRLLLAAGSGLPLADAILPALAEAPACLDAAAIARHGDAAPLASAGAPDSLAYVIFTSGSTGTPKGAMVEQRGMLNNIFGKLPAIGLCDSDRLAQTASPAFDISIWQFLAAPLAGGTVHILPDAVAHDPERLAQAIDAHGITLLELVPAQIRALLDGAPDSARLASLRWLMSIGEALPPELCRRWFARFPAIALMNLYGPAECADNIAFQPLTAAPGDDVVHLPVGRPTANNQLYVLDAALRRVPVGVPGEICAAGAGVGRGYLADPERTRAAFPRHPFAPGARFYRTGDLGRYRADGAIEFLGRRDQQVKVQGHRIELGEIESRLQQHPAVAAAAVLALPAADGGQRLAGFWQAKPGMQADAAALHAHLFAVLPAYMVPQELECLTALPLNANGKVDRKQLAAQRPAQGTSPALAPRNTTETRLAQIWCDVLRIKSVGVEDNFFALGGHSLLATQVVARIRAVLGRELPLRILFDHPTIAALAARLDGGPAEPALLPPIGAADRQDALPLSFAQQRMWFLEQLAPGSGALNIPFALRLRGELDTQALRRSLELLVQRHEVLRTVFDATDGVPRLRIMPAMPFSLPLSDCLTMPPAQLNERLGALARHGFDLGQAPLLRAELLRTADTEHVLLVVLHHIVADGWSFALLVDELAEAYRSLCRGVPPALPAPGLQYADYAHWQQQHLPGAQWQRQLAYWRRQLDGSPGTLLLPGARSGGAQRQPARHRAALDAGLAQALGHQAQHHEASLFMVLHAALNVLLYQQTGRDDLLLGTDVANRHHAQTETMVGFFVNQLVLRCRLRGAQAFSAVLAECRRVALEAFQRQDLPFDALVADLLPRRAPGQSPLFQIKLVLQNTRQQELRLDGLAIEEIALGVHAAELDLLINVIPAGEGYDISYDYDAARYDGATIAQLDLLYRALLQTVAADTAQTVDTLASFLAERQRALREAAPSATQPAAGAARPALGSVRRKALPI